MASSASSRDIEDRLNSESPIRDIFDGDLIGERIRKSTGSVAVSPGSARMLTRGVSSGSASASALKRRTSDDHLQEFTPTPAKKLKADDVGKKGSALENLSKVLGDRKASWFNSIVVGLDRSTLVEIVLQAAASDPKIRDFVRQKSLEPPTLTETDLSEFSNML